MATIEEIRSDPEIDDVESTDCETDEEMPELATKDNIAEDGSVKVSRSEKKARKHIQKLGLKPVAGCVRVTVRKSKNVLFVISKPDVHKAVGSETYVIFGEAKIEDLSAKEQETAAEKLSKAPIINGSVLGKLEDKVKAEESSEAEMEGEVDETGIDSNDIKLIMDQTKCSRFKAVQALRQNNNDLVEAIMQLSD